MELIDEWEDRFIKEYDGVESTISMTAEQIACPKQEMPEDEKDPTVTRKYIPRETLRRVATPQAYRFDLLDQAYHEAFEKKIGIYGSSYTNTMMTELGHELHFAAGSDKNLKLTTPGDLEIFRAYLANQRKS